MPAVSEPGGWWVYIILTDKQQFYTGITTDIDRRFLQHCDVANGVAGASGAKFFRTQKPVSICYRESFMERGAASKREAEIKKLSRTEKKRLCGID